MVDHVVDTNVLLVASAVQGALPRFADTHVPEAQCQVVFEWLDAFRGDADRCVVMDGAFKLYEEYLNKLTVQHFGMLVILEKLSTGRIVEVEYDTHGYALVPEAFAKFDNSDKKLLAAALTDPETINIVNAADSDWYEIAAELEAVGLEVVQLLDKWLRGGS